MSGQDQDQARAAWDSIAAGFDEFATPVNMRLGEEAVQRVGLTAGMHFKDVAAGCGALSIPAARTGAKVLATDISPAMVEHLKARADALGLSQLEARPMDGHALELEDDTFDVSGSQFGVMLFPDVKRGIAELVRVTRPGGRVVLVVFGPPPKLEFIGFFIKAMKTVVPGFTGPPMDPPPLSFQLSDPEKLRRELSEAGLQEVTVETLNHPMLFDSGAHMWNMVTTGNPIGAMLVADLTEEQKAEVQQVLDGMLKERSEGTGVAVLDNAVHIGIGTK